MTFRKNNRPKLYAFCGLPGAGKSTVARELEKKTGAIRLNVDEWVAALGMDFWDEDFRHKIDRRLYEHGLDLLKRGQSIIFEDNFWTRAERDEYRKIAHRLGIAIEMHYFDVPFEELWQRLQNRNTIGAHGAVPITKDLLMQCWAKFEPLGAEELSLFDGYVIHK